MLLCQVDVALSLLDVLSITRLILLVFHVVMAELDAVLQTTLKHTAKNIEDLLKSLKQNR